MNFIYVDTGALYRTVGLSLSQSGTGTDNEQAVAEHLKGITVDLEYTGGEQRVFLCGKDVSGEIRTPEMSMMASKCSALPVVREFLLGLQRKLAEEHNVIMDGRDIGTVILPFAQIKIFLTADAEERAQRRYKELIEKGEEVNYTDVLSELKERDYNDSHRVIAPLKPAADSHIIDTTGIGLEESVEMLHKFVTGLLDRQEQ